MSEPKNGDIFLNGKAQVVEMLRYMKEDERERLIRQIRLQSSSLANELSGESIGFEQLGTLPDSQMQNIFNYIEAPILGMAIRGLGVELQKRILSLAERSYAEEAYEFMTMKLKDEWEKSRQAQEKVGIFVAKAMQG